MTPSAQPELKLARVKHFRCGEQVWERTTFVWIPPDMSQAEFQLLCEKARESYMAAEKALRDSPDKPPYAYIPQFDRVPDEYNGLTVAEAKAKYEAKKVAWDEWEKREKAARKTFAQHLVAVGEGRIVDFWQAYPTIAGEVQWGHNHGWVIALNQKQPNAEDINATKEEDEE